jgi:hypothetical protein
MRGKAAAGKKVDWAWEEEFTDLHRQNRVKDGTSQLVGVRRSQLRGRCATPGPLQRHLKTTNTKVAHLEVLSCIPARCSWSG